MFVSRYFLFNGFIVTYELLYSSHYHMITITWLMGLSVTSPSCYTTLFPTVNLASSSSPLSCSLVFPLPVLFSITSVPLTPPLLHVSAPRCPEPRRPLSSLLYSFIICGPSFEYSIIILGNSAPCFVDTLFSSS